MNMTIGDMKISDPLVDQLLNACLAYDPQQRPGAHQIMHLQDKLETQEYGYARSRFAMEIINGEVPESQYASYIDNDPIFAQISQSHDDSYLLDQIQTYENSSGSLMHMGD